MNISLTKTLEQIKRKLDREDGLSAEDLKKAYDLTLRLRSQLLGVIYDLETFGTAGTDGLICLSVCVRGMRNLNALRSRFMSRCRRLKS